jgi:hypothetical protein
MAERREPIVELRVVEWINDAMAYNYSLQMRRAGGKWRDVPVFRSPPRASPARSPLPTREEDSA